jgi:hypothetical protein
MKTIFYRGFCPTFTRMKRIVDFFADLPRPVRYWALSILAALGYLIFRHIQVVSPEEFHPVDRLLALYSTLSLIIFIGFFLTKDPG